MSCSTRAAWRKRKDGGGFWEMIKEKREASVKEKMLKDIEKKLRSDYFGRTEAAEALKGLMSRETLRALDRKGQGPESTMFGGRRQYERRSFIAWLETRITEPSVSEE